jgi:hypothetical protein
MRSGEDKATSLVVCTQSRQRRGAAAEADALRHCGKAEELVVPALKLKKAIKTDVTPN